jgi:hypothetical protein
VTKQRDNVTDGHIAFQLSQVVLGNNQDGEPVTSCIVDPIVAPQQTPRPKSRLAPAQVIGQHTRTDRTSPFIGMSVCPVCPDPDNDPMRPASMGRLMRSTCRSGDPVGWSCAAGNSHAGGDGLEPVWLPPGIGNTLDERSEI